jgi:hypothetical protein
MKRLVQCVYSDLRTGETWVRLFRFDALTGERSDPAIEEIENAPLPDPKRPYWGGPSR